MADATIPTFQPGDVVQLKSSGPLMTVREEYTDYGKQLVSLYYASERNPAAELEGILAAALKKVDLPQTAS